MSAMLAIGWEPELRGVLTVLIGVGVLCGSVYFILATNLGIRLGLLVALGGLAGWMALMGLAWLIYGIGLQGPAPSWEPVAGQTILSEPDVFVQAGVLDEPVDVAEGATPAESADAVAEAFDEEGWVTIAESDAAFGEGSARAGELMEETSTFAAGEYQVTRLFDIGGERWPKLGDSLDFLAFFHDPHYAVAEVAPLEPTREEPGRAPATPEIDETRPRQYVYMIRDLGARRQPALVTLVGSSIILLAIAYLLHRRDALLTRNRESTPATAS